MAALSFVLAGPTTAAVAAAPPPPAAGDSSDGKKPNPWDWAYWKMHEFLNPDAHDTHDKWFRWKTIGQVAGARVLKLMNKGKEPGFGSILTGLHQDYHEVKKRMMKTPKGAREQVKKSSEAVHEAKKNAEQAQTPKAKEKADKATEKARNWNKEAAANLRESKATAHPDTKAEIRKVEAKIRNLEEKITNLETKKAKVKHKGEQNRVQRSLNAARERLTKAQAQRAEFGDGPDDTGGTRPVELKPKTPSQGPGSTNAKTPPTPLVSNTTKKPSATNVQTPPVSNTTKDPSATNVKIPRKAPTITAVKPRQPVVPSVRTPGGVRGVRGSVAADAVGDLVGQATDAYLSRKNQKVLDKALSDPEMRARLIAEHREYQTQGPFQQLARPFKGKEFTPGEMRENGPKLIKVEKTLDTVRKKADRSNADPLYRQARTECGGYDTCVTERTRSLRDKNTKDIAESTRKARKSNADPAYRQARTECGGYDTCVTERTRKLRAEQAKDTVKDRAGKGKRDRDDNRAQHSGKTSNGKSKDTTSSRGDRSDRGQHKDAKTGPAKSQYENRAV
ncbi:hypothetical protein ACF05T_31985 [Streptomyces lateritius]|uniref:Uncharacterized protein n=1 Tax=Streptomyces lateritius TaxID=67313 RepID=A0ABW6YMB1_9ACTN